MAGGEGEGDGGEALQPSSGRSRHHLQAGPTPGCPQTAPLPH